MRRETSTPSPTPAKPQPDASLSIDSFDSPVGPLALAVRGEVLLLLAFADEAPLPSELARRFAGSAAERSIDPRTTRATAARVRDALTRYFQGELHALESVPVDGAGTPFQRSVWAALREIPVGETRSYGQIAQRIGNPKAVRAVGLANGQNPIAIVVPCHRVIGANGSLTGYGGGLERKRWLLAHESAAPALALRFTAEDAESAESFASLEFSPRTPRPSR